MYNVLINQGMRVTEPLDPLEQTLKVLSWAHHFQCSMPIQDISRLLTCSVELARSLLLSCCIMVLFCVKVLNEMLIAISSNVITKMN